MKPQTFDQQFARSRENQLRAQVGMVCSLHGATSWQLFWYYNFARQMNKHWQGYDNDKLTRAAVGLVADYVGRGLRRDVLLAIAANVFSLELH